LGCGLGGLGACPKKKLKKMRFKKYKMVGKSFTIEQHYLRMMRQGNHFFFRQILHEQSKEQHK
jgi:hypothetical protein